MLDVFPRSGRKRLLAWSSLALEFHLRSLLKLWTRDLGELLAITESERPIRVCGVLFRASTSLRSTSLTNYMPLKSVPSDTCSWGKMITKEDTREARAVS